MCATVDHVGSLCHAKDDKVELVRRWEKFR